MSPLAEAGELPTEDADEHPPVSIPRRPDARRRRRRAGRAVGRRSLARPDRLGRAGSADRWDRPGHLHRDGDRRPRGGRPTRMGQRLGGWGGALLDRYGGVDRSGGPPPRAPPPPRAARAPRPPAPPPPRPPGAHRPPRGGGRGPAPPPRLGPR